MLRLGDLAVQEAAEIRVACELWLTSFRLLPQYPFDGTQGQGLNGQPR